MQFVKEDSISLPTIEIKKTTYRQVTDYPYAYLYMYDLFVNGRYERSFNSRDDLMSHLEVLIQGEIV